MNNKKAYVRHELEVGTIEYDLVQQVDGTFKYAFVKEENMDYKKRWGRWACAARCGLFAAMIAASDGPSPLMDVAAAAYAYSCGSDC